MAFSKMVLNLIFLTLLYLMIKLLPTAISQLISALGAKQSMILALVCLLRL